MLVSFVRVLQGLEGVPSHVQQSRSGNTIARRKVCRAKPSVHWLRTALGAHRATAPRRSQSLAVAHSRSVPRRVVYINIVPHLSDSTLRSQFMFLPQSQV